MNEEEKVVKHLEMILGVIERMARNSFMLKSWTVALIVASLWLSARYGGNVSIILIIIITAGFWWLDGYFLRQERLFRKLYDHIRLQQKTDFSMCTSPFSENVSTVWYTCVGKFSTNTLLLFYGLTLSIGLLLSCVFALQGELYETCIF